MPRQQVDFHITSPESPDSTEPTQGLAPGIFLRPADAEANPVDLPREIDGEVVVKGMIVRGMGFHAKTADGVRPHDLSILKRDGKAVRWD